MQKVLHVEGCQRVTEWNSAMHEKLYMPSRAHPPQDKEKIKNPENKAAKKEETAVKLYPT